MTDDEKRKKVRIYREYLKLPQSYVASKIGMHQSNYCKMEKAYGNPQKAYDFLKPSFEAFRKLKIKQLKEELKKLESI